MSKNAQLDVKGTTVRVVKIDGVDFVCLTDMAKLKSDDPQQTISNWMRNRMTIEYLGLWETLYNPDFKPLEFEGFRKFVQSLTGQIPFPTEVAEGTGMMAFGIILSPITSATAATAASSGV